MKKTLSSSTTIHVAAVTAIAAIAAYISALKYTNSSKPIRSRFSLLPDYNQDNHSEKPIFVPGLRNLANNCFLNVVLQVSFSFCFFNCAINQFVDLFFFLFLQALASCVCFQSFLHSVIAEYGTDEQLVQNMPLVFSLASLVQGTTTLFL